MTRVTMTQTTQGSRDGITIETFVAGQSYTIPDNLARNFKIMGVIADAPAAAPENKAIPKAPETKPAPVAVEVKAEPEPVAEPVEAIEPTADPVPAVEVVTAPARGRRRGA